jgi:hypothetical protein
MEERVGRGSSPVGEGSRHGGPPQRQLRGTWVDVTEASLGGQRARGMAAGEEKGNGLRALQTGTSVAAEGKNGGAGSDLPGEGEGDGGCDIPPLSRDGQS